MSRYLTPTERAMLATGAGYLTRATLSVTDFDGTWHNLGALAVGAHTLRMFNTAQLSDDIDRNTLSMDATVKREAGAYSLSPFRSDSPLNVDAASTYQPLLDLHREWRIDAVFADRSTPPTLPADYREMASGIVDRIDISGDPAIITVQGRGREADLIDWKIVGPKTYASGTIEDVLQAIVDGELGAGVVPITLAASAPSYFVNGWEQKESIGLFDLMTQVAALAGANLRYLYDVSDVLSLTLFTPPRTAAPGDEDWEIGGTEYETLSVGIGLENVRNFVVVKYMSTAGVILTATSPALPTSASISRYGLRVLEIDLSADTKVNDITGAQPLADAVVSDWELPPLEQQLTAHGLWFGTLYDYVKTLANGIAYDEDQYGAVMGYTQTFANGMLSSAYQLRGKPAGRYATWLDYGSGPPETQAPLLVECTTDLAAPYTHADISVRPTGAPGEMVTVWKMDEADGVIWTLCQGAADPTPKYVVSGTLLDFHEFYQTGGVITPVFQAFYLGALNVSRLMVKAVSQSAREGLWTQYSARQVPTDTATVTWTVDPSGALMADAVPPSGGVVATTFRPIDNEPPTSNFATLDVRNGHPVLDFDTTTQEAAIFTGVLSAGYGGNGITVAIYCALTSATSGTVGWDVAIERVDASGLDIDSDSFASAQTVTATTVPGTSGQILKLSVNISNGANMDSLAAGELFRLRVRRDVANDTATGDAELLAVTIVEQ